MTAPALSLAPGTRRTKIRVPLPAKAGPLKQRCGTLTAGEAVASAAAEGLRLQPSRSVTGYKNVYVDRRGRFRARVAQPRSKRTPWQHGAPARLLRLLSARPAALRG